jgi:hypothetical protein
MHRLRRIGHQSIGIFSASAWLEEGDGLLVSARSTRATWLRKRRAFPRRIETPGASSHLWSELTGLPRASVLLLGYSVEMYLKAGLVKAYNGCREEMFSSDVKKFGHDLKKLASEIDLPDANKSAADFKLLQSLIVEGARYPITPKDVKDFNIVVGQNAARMWSAAEFHRLCALSKRVRTHASQIDCDENNPVHLSYGNIGDTGYWVFRIGGHLSPRVTYRPNIDLQDVKKYVERDPAFRAFTKWDDCKTRVDKT